MRASGFDEAMGVRVVSASADEVILECDIDERHLQPYGIVHGGMYCALVETACSIGAGIHAMAGGRSAVGLDNSTSFLKAVRGGCLRVTATPLTRGRRSQVWEATIRDGGGIRVAVGRLRLLCLEPDTVLAGTVVGS